MGLCSDVCLQDIKDYFLAGIKYEDDKEREVIIKNENCPIKKEKTMITKQEVFDVLLERGEVTWGLLYSILEERGHPEGNLEVKVNEYYDLALSELSVCPECKSILSSLIESESGFNQRDVEVVNGLFYVIDEIGFTSDNTYINYQCPCCETILFENIIDVKQFLSKNTVIT